MQDRVSAGFRHGWKSLGRKIVTISLELSVPAVTSVWDTFASSASVQKKVSSHKRQPLSDGMMTAGDIQNLMSPI